MSRRVFYLNYYSHDGDNDSLKVVYSCIPKVDYIVKKLLQCGERVTIVSAVNSNKGIFKGKTVQLEEGLELKYFTTFAAKNRFMRVVNVVFLRMQILVYLLTNIKNDDKLIVYHSMFYRNVIEIYKRVFRKRFCLEIEDVFTSVNKNISNMATKEWRYFRFSDSYLCVNDLLKEKLPKEKKKLVSYGSYETVPKYEKENSDYKELVYAGIVEQYRNAAFIAIDSMTYLDSTYHLSILGFGDNADLAIMQQKIELVNAKKGYECISFLGRKSGDEYYQYLQNCDVALSTHVYDETNMKSADDTFPSKLLVYLANNLKIVAQRLECLEKSVFNQHIFFYDKPEPKLIAKTIERAFNSKNYQMGSELIMQLDKVFAKQLEDILNY